jgi:hypothetical protein
MSVKFMFIIDENTYLLLLLLSPCFNMSRSGDSNSGQQQEEQELRAEVRDVITHLYQSLKQLISIIFIWWHFNYRLFDYLSISLFADAQSIRQHFCCYVERISRRQLGGPGPGPAVLRLEHEFLPQVCEECAALMMSTGKIWYF